MDNKKTLKIHLYLSISYILFGGILFFANIRNEDKFGAGFFAMLVITGVVRSIQYIFILKDEKRIHKYEVSQSDERNEKIATEARSTAFLGCLFLMMIAFFVLYIMKLELYANIAAISLCAMSLIYLVCYLIIRKIY